MMPLRTLEFDEPSKSYLVRDSQLVVRACLHTQEAVDITGETALDAAESYLRTHAELLELDTSHLRNLRLRPLDEPSDVGVELRFFSEKRQFDVTTITFQQTHSGLPVWQAGISVHLKERPTRATPAAGKPAGRYRVVCAQIVGQAAPSGASFPRSPEVVARIRTLDQSVLADQLGISGKTMLFESESLRIRHQRLMIYCYEDANRARNVPATVDSDTTSRLAIPLPAVSAQISEGSHYLVAAVYFDLAPANLEPVHWVALVEPTTLSVLYLDVLSAGVNGLVFVADPATTNGGPPPSADNAQLDPLRVSMPLQGLVQPNGMQELRGDNVFISDFSSPHIGPPKKPGGQDFNFEVRSDDFAAVNAYYHCDRFFRLVEELGFKRADYFPGTTFPTPVDHRGTDPHRPFTPVVIYAQCQGTTISGPDGTIIGGIENTLFCLADLGGPPYVGIACDWRVVLHELGGHGTLNNHVNSSFFGFAHSAGDSFAAILNDPESRACDKGHTFPWASFDRRHDRTTAAGWDWDGAIDRNDFYPFQKREQILTSTHFRLYQSIGGGSSLADVRRFAARFTIYLILRAIQSLTPVTNPQHASDWLCNLLVADASDWTTERHSGGAYEKVIGWAFEKQGLFGGAAPDVDVYIDDGRGGEYPFQSDHTSCPAIWNRHSNDGDEHHQAPLPNVVNYAYVKIKSRGGKTAKSVVVKAFQSTPQPVLLYPDDWTPMQTPELSVPDLPAGSGVEKVGPFAWVPSIAGNSMLMAVSADGDVSNLHKFTAGKSIPDWRLVPNDNNLGMRNV